jgi:HAD superfamily hydrolase (TIGR01549 family)
VVDEHLPHPEVVFFDLFGTVFKWSKAPRDAMAAVLARAGHPVDSGVIYQQWREIERRLPSKDEYPGDSEVQYWRHYDGALLTRLGIDPTDELVAQIRAEFERDVHLGLQEDALPSLAALKKAGARMGVISNSTHGMVRDFARLKLKPYFESVVYSQPLNARKPDPHIFLVALSKFGVPPTRAWMVGDDPDHDVRGASGVGIVPILIDRAGRHPDVASTRVADLREVVRLYNESDR